MHELGEWRRRTGFVIRGAGPSPFPQAFAWGWCTQAPGNVLQFVVRNDWTNDLEVCGLRTRVLSGTTAEAQASTVPVSDIVEPQQEQVITQEDQKEPQGNELQLVFLGDSIFDTYRDGTGIPYRTAVQCQA